MKRSAFFWKKSKILGAAIPKDFKDLKDPKDLSGGA